MQSKNSNSCTASASRFRIKPQKIKSRKLWLVIPHLLSYLQTFLNGKNLYRLKGQLIKFTKNKNLSKAKLTLVVREVTKMKVSWRSGEHSGEILLYTLFIYLFSQSFCSFWKRGCLCRWSFGLNLCPFVSRIWIEKSRKSTRNSCSGFLGYLLNLSSFASLTENVMTLETAIEHFYYGMLSKEDE